jgi:hypothetical protein
MSQLEKGHPVRDVGDFSWPLFHRENMTSNLPKDGPLCN